LSLIKNKDLLNWPSNNRPDNLFVVTKPPKRNDNDVVINIHLDENAAVLDSDASLYPDQPTISKIREGKGSRWLLSGGTLITDQEGRIAVGLRDGNSVDPFIFTNIGAGRCDQKLIENCEQEMASEFILCLKKDDNHWYQADFGQYTKLLTDLNRPDVKMCVEDIVNSFNKSGYMIDRFPYKRGTIQTDLTGNISINWIYSGDTLQESLKGYVLADAQNKTTEFRLGLILDLSGFTDNRIFFGEGTGYAEWMSLDCIKDLVRAEEIAGRRFVTPFLRAL
jgi:hypothetical protein